MTELPLIELIDNRPVWQPEQVWRDQSGFCLQTPRPSPGPFIYYREQARIQDFSQGGRGLTPRNLSFFIESRQTRIHDFRQRGGGTRPPLMEPDCSVYTGFQPGGRPRPPRDLTYIIESRNGYRISGREGKYFIHILQNI